MTVTEEQILIRQIENMTEYLSRLHNRVGALRDQTLDASELRDLLRSCLTLLELVDDDMVLSSDVIVEREI